MTNHRSRWLRRWAAVALVVAGAACSTAPVETRATSSSTSAAARSQAVEFAQCMRDNGVGEFPDPDASGELTIDGVANHSSLDPSTPAFTQALDACRDLEPGGFTGHERTAEQQAAGLRFAQCMRDNGVPDFADPDPDGPLIDIDGSTPGLKAAVHAAGQTCSRFAAAAGVTGER